MQYAALLQACETLDKRAGLPRSLMWPLDPPVARAIDESAQEEQQQEQEQELPPEVQEWEELAPSSKLAALLSHLRFQHHHCQFCGVQVGALLFASCVLCAPLRQLAGSLCAGT